MESSLPLKDDKLASAREYQECCVCVSVFVCVAKFNEEGVSCNSFLALHTTWALKAVWQMMSLNHCAELADGKTLAK